MVDADEDAFVGWVAGLRDVVTFEGATYAEVEQAFRDSLDDRLAFCAERSEPPDRPYSGEILLRVDPELHRRAAAQAQAAGVSPNQDRRAAGARPGDVTARVMRAWLLLARVAVAVDGGAASPSSEG